MLCESGESDDSARIPDILCLSDSSMCLGSSGSLSKGCNINHETLSEMNEYVKTTTSPTSTFRTTCNTATADDIIFNRINRDFINQSAVRTEEFLNWYDFNLDVPSTDTVSITENISKKNNSNIGHMLIGIKGKKHTPDKQNIVILLDVSGSMENSEKEIQAAIFTIISKLNSGDKLSLITYSCEDNIVISSLTIPNEGKQQLISNIIRKVLKIKVGGCTYGSHSLERAYEIIENNKILNDNKGVNRVVIITDGDFNFGDCQIDSVKKDAARHKETGAYISVIGAGSIQGNDAIMEAIAKNRNGNYCCISTPESVDKNINKNYDKLVFTIATDVKAQVEFNPKFIDSYRLIGYENRRLEHGNFKNDDVVSEPFCSGSQCIAMYELMFKDNNTNANTEEQLKYQSITLKDTPDVANELCTISVRLKEAITKQVEQYSHSVKLSDLEESNKQVDKALEIIDICDKLKSSECNDKQIESLLKQMETL